MNTSGPELREALRAARSGISSELQAAASRDLRDRLVVALETMTPKTMTPKIMQPSASAPIVCSYLPYQGEIDPEPAVSVLRKWGWRTALPVIGPRASMTFVEWAPGDALSKNKYGIAEPVGPPISPTNIGVMLIPGVGFDRYGSRVGHGVGFYDRFLEPFRDEVQPLRIGVAHDIQIAKLLRPEPWDVPMHLVVTDRQIVDARR